MILVAAVAVVALSVLLAGGSFGRLVRISLKARGAVVAALAIQVLTISVIPGLVAGWVGRTAQLLSYALAVTFLVANRKVPWLWLVGLGGLCNLIAIGANRGVMPASAVAMRAAGRVHQATRFQNSTSLLHPRLAFLGDNFSIPRSWPLANVFSIGDILLVVGLALLLHEVTGSRLAGAARTVRALGRPPRRTSAASPATGLPVDLERTGPGA